MAGSSSSAGYHTWETDRKRPRRFRVGDAMRDDVGFWGEFLGSEDEEIVESLSLGDELVKHLLNLHQRNKISASDCTTAMYWSWKSGVVEAQKYALSESAQSGHCSEKFKKSLGYSAKNDCFLK